MTAMFARPALLAHSLQRLYSPVAVVLSGENEAAGSSSLQEVHFFSAGGCAGWACSRRCLP